MNNEFHAFSYKKYLLYDTILNSHFIITNYREQQKVLQQFDYNSYIL